MKLRKLSSVMLSTALLSISATAAATEPELAPLPAPPAAAWYELIELSAFVDGYASINYNFPKPNEGASRGRAFDQDTGFALGWAGVDASFPAEPVGGTLSLRFGPNAKRYNEDEVEGLEQVTQAFASFRPVGPKDPLRLDFGKFDSIYGVEAAESHLNHHYSPGLIFTYVTPASHLGVRLAWELDDALALNALVVNGWDRSLDTNAGKTFGAQLVVRPSQRLDVSLGWLGGPEQPDTLEVSCPDGTSYQVDAAGCAASPGASAATHTVDRGGANEFGAWRHLFDAVIAWRPTDSLDLYGSFNYRTEGVRQDTLTSDTESLKHLAGALGARYALSAAWAVAARGEYLRVTGEEVDGQPALSAEHFPLGVPDLSLASATLTLELRPTDHLILRLENRADFALDAHSSASTRVFAKEVRDAADSQITTTLGVVVTTH